VRGTSRPTGLFVGLCTLDAVHVVDRMPGQNDKVTAREQLIAAGGPATNAAVTFAALGGQAYLVTAVGDGPIGRLVRADLAGCGVHVVDAAAGSALDVPVSSISVLEGTGDRSIVSVDASAIEVNDPPDLAAAAAASDVLLLDGHHPALAREAARAARAAGTPAVLDAGRWRPVMADLIPALEAVICSADFRPPDVDDVLAWLTHRGVRIAAVTDGGDPVKWRAGERAGTVTPPRIRPVDTAGAGDVLHGAYCYATAHWPDTDVPARLAWSCELAALKCQSLGTRRWLTELSGRSSGAL
jgi:sugar/nucleoside kinase (ribokinase family)